MTITMEGVKSAFEKISPWMLADVKPTYEKPVIDYTEAVPPMVVEKVHDRFLRELTAVIREAGDQHVSTPRLPLNSALMQFRYVYGGKPDCVVGRVLHRMGVSIETMSRCEGHSAAMLVATAWGEGDLVGSQEDRRVVGHLACAAQSMNDRGVPWGAMRSITAKPFL